MDPYRWSEFYMHLCNDNLKASLSTGVVAAIAKRALERTTGCSDAREEENKTFGSAYCQYHRGYQLGSGWWSHNRQEESVAQ